MEITCRNRNCAVKIAHRKSIHCEKHEFGRSIEEFEVHTYLIRSRYEWETFDRYSLIAHNTIVVPTAVAEWYWDWLRWSHSTCLLKLCRLWGLLRPCLFVIFLNYYYYFVRLENRILDRSECFIFMIGNWMQMRDFRRHWTQNETYLLLSERNRNATFVETRKCSRSHKGKFTQKKNVRGAAYIVQKSVR